MKNSKTTIAIYTLPNLARVISIFLVIFLIGYGYAHSTLSGNMVEINGVEYKCAESDETLWLCFEEFETIFGFDDYRVAFDYNPQTKTVGNIAHYADGEQL